MFLIFLPSWASNVSKMFLKFTNPIKWIYTRIIYLKTFLLKSLQCFFISNFCGSNVAVLVFNVFKFQIIIILCILFLKYSVMLRSVTWMALFIAFSRTLFETLSLAMFLNCFLIFAWSQPHVSYKNVSYKKKMCITFP